MFRFLVALPLVAALLGEARAQDTVDIGVIKNSDVTVVQKLLFPKKDRTELGLHVGVMPFDAFLFTPNLQFSFDMHQNERLGISVLAGGGYGIKNGAYQRLDSPTYGVAVDAYRYLASLLAGVEYAPVYAKAMIGGARIVHYDVYGVARAGATLEQSVIPKGGFTVAPTLSLGIGSRVFVGERAAVRIELRDDMMGERRSLTSSTHFKQNIGITVGYTLLSPVKQRQR